VFIPPPIQLASLLPPLLLTLALILSISETLQRLGIQC
jgi:hypothetical protein